MAHIAGKEEAGVPVLTLSPKDAAVEGQMLDQLGVTIIAQPDVQADSLVTLPAEPAALTEPCAVIASEPVNTDHDQLWSTISVANKHQALFSAIQHQQHQRRFPSTLCL